MSDWHRAQAMLRSKLRAAERREARRQRMSTRTLKRERLKAMTTEAFEAMQRRLVPPVKELRVRDE